MRIAAKLGCVGLVVTLAGCSSLSALNPFAHKAPPRNPPAPLTDFTQTLAVRTQWTASIGKAGAFLFAPAAVGDSVYVAAADGTLARLDAANGKTLWRIDTGHHLTAGVGSDGTTVVVAADKGVLLAYDANGKLRWKAQASTQVLSTPAVGRGMVVVRSVDNHIVAYDAESGARRWNLERSEPSLILHSAPGIVIAGPGVFVGLPGGRLLALEPNSGAPRWEAAIGEPRGATELERIADISGVPVVAGNDICAVAYQGKVACLDMASGTPLWDKQLSSEVGLGVDGRFIFAANDRGVVIAFSRDTGATAWNNNKLTNRNLAAPVSVGSAVAVGDGQGYVHFLSPEDGRFVARVATDGSRVISAEPLADGHGAVFQTQAGEVVALTAE